LIYLDSSVVLARVFAEANSPSDAFWLQRFTSSKLLEYEVMNRVNQRMDLAQRAANARVLIDNVELIDLTPVALARALALFPIPVKTLDGLHLATMHYLRANGQNLRLASYDKRLIAAANAIGVAVETGL
jgi:predicted nucleic acid-binding protein